MSDSVLLTDSDDAAVDDAVAQLDGWRVERVAPASSPTRVARGRASAPCSSTTDDPDAAARRASSARTRAAFRSSSAAPTTRRAAAPSSCGRGVVPLPGRRRGDRAAHSRRRSRAARRSAPATRRSRRARRVRADAARFAHRAADAAGDDRALAQPVQGARRARRAVPQLRALLEDRGDLRLGEARRGARDDGGGGARVPRRHGARARRA